jgi:transposase
MSGNVRKAARKYTNDYKVEAVKLVREIGNSKASIELGVPRSTLSQWTKKAEIGLLDTGTGTQNPGSAMTQAMEIHQLRIDNKELEKKNARLKKENEFLEEASAFFAASRQKLTKKSV